MPGSLVGVTIRRTPKGSVTSPSRRQGNRPGCSSRPPSAEPRRRFVGAAAPAGDRRRRRRPGRRGGRGRLGELPVGRRLRRRCGTSQIGPLDLEHWAADGALTLFFYVAGLELKREFLVGSLRKPADALVPIVAAVCRGRHPGAGLRRRQRRRRLTADLEGWAIPAATDIAFALAVLAVVGSSLPTPAAARSCSRWPWSTTSSSS